MLTGRRIRERQAAEAAGLPPPPPPAPSSISYQEHLAEIGRINKAHAVELSDLRKSKGGGKGKAQLEALTAERDEAVTELEATKADLAKVTAERDEALEELAELDEESGEPEETADKPAAEGSGVSPPARGAGGGESQGVGKSGGGKSRSR